MLCTKGLYLGETLQPESRLLRPRVGGRETGWDEALDLIASRFRETLAEHGPDSIAIYASGQLLTEDYYVANKLMKGYIGSANIDTNSRLCMASAVVAHTRGFGSDTVPGTFQDLEQADLVVLVGSNLAWCHPVLHRRLVAAKAARPSLTVVNIDPRRTATSVLADLQLSVRPGSDLALFNGLLAEIAHSGAIDGVYVDAHTKGLGEALEAAERQTVAETAAITGLTRHSLAQFYDLWISNERVVTLFSQGINQSVTGSDKASAIINCHLATGRIGREGMGPFSITGQPNAMGGREVGGLSTMLAAHLELGSAEHRKAVQSFWNSPTIAEKPGLKAVDLFGACADGRVKALWILSTNPVDSMPDADAVREAIRRCPVVVLSDIVDDTDTAREVDILLPAAGWGEKSGTVTNADRTISRERAFQVAPAEARPDWRIVCDVAGRMGWREAFAFPSPAAVFREHAALSGVAGGLGRGFDVSDLAEIDDDAYDALRPFRWPRARDKQGGRFFGAGGFHTDDRRARLIATPWRSCLPDTSDDWPLRLNTGRVRDHWHTMTRTGHAPHLARRHVEPFVDVHPTDAARLDIGSGDLAILESPLAQVIVRAHVTDDVPAGSVFTPMHWSGSFASHARIDALVPPACDPVSGQPAFKGAVARLARFDLDWRGIAAARQPFQPKTAYWALIRALHGWAATFASENWNGPDPSLLGLKTDGHMVTIASGPDCFFAAIAQNDTIDALYLVSRTRPGISAMQLASQLGQDADADRLDAWRLQTEAQEPSSIVCACFAVDAETIRSAIADRNLGNVEAVGRTLHAGTRCGTCRPEIAALLGTQRQQTGRTGV